MNFQPVPDRQEIERALGLGTGARTTRLFKRLIWLAVLAALVAGGWWWWQARQSAANTVSYETQAAEKGSLTVSVTATGTLQPTTQVDVSSEMSGIVRSVKVDDNSQVKQGDVLAELDTERYSAQLRSLQASLEAAKAKLADAKASLTAANLTLDRQRSLQRKGLTPTQDRDNAVASQLRAEATVAGAEAEIDIAKSNLSLKQLDIGKSTIRSPINGIVLKRAAEPGQTVASSLQAPILFTLAEDLTRMQLEAEIDEADIGTVKVDQKATFTVDAYGGRDFSAIIQSIQFSPKTENGVVTYKAVLTVDNADLSLRPGMTATAKIVTQEIQDALLVPNAALRYNPPAAAKSEGFSISRLFLPRMPSSRGQPKQTTDGERTVWTLKDNAPVAIKVTTAESDGRMTVVSKGEVTAGMPLITSARTWRDKSMTALLALDKASKIYGEGGGLVRALAAVDVEINAGEFVAIMGPSGSGKSTAMNILGCLDTPSSGRFLFNGVDATHLSQRCARAAAAQLPGLRVPGLQSTEAHHGPRKCRTAAHLQRRCPARTAGAGAACAASRRP